MISANRISGLACRAAGLADLTGGVRCAKAFRVAQHDCSAGTSRLSQSLVLSRLVCACVAAHLTAIKRTPPAAC
jgi:hypothetical protein